MALQHRPQARKIDAFGIVDEEHRVRIADIDRDRVLERTQRQIEMQRVRRLGERDIAPIEAR